MSLKSERTTQPAHLATHKAEPKHDKTDNHPDPTTRPASTSANTASARWAPALGPIKRNDPTRFDAASAAADAKGSTPQAQAEALTVAFSRSDAAAVFAQLRGNTAEDNEHVQAAYRQLVGRDLEYDLRGFKLDPGVRFNDDGFPRADLRGGLRATELATALNLLHGPRAAATAAALRQLTAQPLTPQTLGDIYRLLQRAGGEERTRVSSALKALTGKNLVDTLKPVFEQAAAMNNRRPLPTPPDKTVAIVVSSGNWKKQLDGTERDAKGGYHWREIEAYVKEALDRGYQPVFFTPDGLPPSPDAASLLLGQLGPKVGFGLLNGHGPDSHQGKAILDGLMHPRSMESFDAKDFATMHIAGGHGSHHDLIGRPTIESAAEALNASGKPVTAVCHATPSLGRTLLEGQPATGFSPVIDSVMVKLGYVLNEFHPPYDAHQGLKELGARVNGAAALLNIHHVESFAKNGGAVITGTGPEATDNVARQVFDVLAKK